MGKIIKKSQNMCNQRVTDMITVEWEGIFSAANPTWRTACPEVDSK